MALLELPFGVEAVRNAPPLITVCCVCWCTAALNETAPGYLSHLTVYVGSIPHVVRYVQRQPPISWYHQLVAHQLETVRLPLQIQKSGTVCRQPSAHLQIVLF